MYNGLEGVLYCLTPRITEIIEMVWNNPFFTVPQTITPLYISFDCHNSAKIANFKIAFIPFNVFPNFLFHKNKKVFQVFRGGTSTPY